MTLNSHDGSEFPDTYLPKAFWCVSFDNKRLPVIRASIERLVVYSLQDAVDNYLHCCKPFGPWNISTHISTKRVVRFSIAITIVGCLEVVWADCQRHIAEVKRLHQYSVISAYLFSLFHFFGA